MKNINVKLTPLNATYSNSLNSIMTNLNNKYESNTERAILIKDSRKSYFKMKRVSNNPYIEFPLFSLCNGDIINVNFDYKTASNSTIYFELYEIDESYTSIKTKQTIVKLTKLNNLYSHNINLPIIKTNNNSIGFLLNIRLVEGNEIELSNINLNIKTNNYNCDYNKELIIINNKELFDYCSSTTLENKINGDDYTPGLSIINNYKTLNSDGSITFNSSDSNFKFKGIAFKLSNMVKRSCAIHVKYKCDEVFSVGFRATHPVTGARYTGKVSLFPTNGEIKEALVRGLTPTNTNLPPKDVVVELSVMDTGNFTLYEVICDNSCVFDNLEYISCNNDFYKSNIIISK